MPHNIKNLRNRLGLTQEQFAAEIGVTWSTVNRWENNRGMPSPLALGHIMEMVQKTAELPAQLRQFFLRNGVRG
jgi:DNA-binding transcriptional regulator YiaG